MKPEHWKRIDGILDSVFDQDRTQWESVLDQACSGDQALRQEIARLLDSYDGAEDFIEVPALEVAARGLAQHRDLVGRQIDSYQIRSQLGKGGMGEVYLASDTKLGRQVAIKVLPQIFARDSDRLARFEREARLLAALNHPNIAAIYDLQDHDGWPYLVLELVEGETLAERLGAGRLELEEALRICSQIAEGLQAAHEKGIIHRDLKPGNIKITSEGRVKLLDFGLAKALVGNGSDPNLPSSPTITEAGTGLPLGTAAYASPEQARSRTVDKKVDIWAFGCVLYEALTGKRAFEGETIDETLGNVLDGEPDWEALPVEIPGRVRALLRRCLQKDSDRRLADMADVQAAIDEVLADATMLSAETDRLESWKEIADYLRCSVRTVRRWETSAGLPVHRSLGINGSQVFAYTSELDDWYSNRQSPLREEPYRNALWVRLAVGALLLVVGALAFWYVSGPRGGEDLRSYGASVGNSVIDRRILVGSDVDTMGSPSPDGRFLSFVDWSTGDLALRDLTSGDKHRLTDTPLEADEWAEQSRISPDGMKVAYTWVLEDADEGLHRHSVDLRVVDRSGSDPRVIYRDEAVRYIAPAAWFPDGKNVLAVLDRENGTHQIGRISVSEASLHVIKSLDKSPRSVDLSPDGRYAVYDLRVSHDSGNRDIFLLSTDGAFEMPLVAHPAEDRLLGWAPDGKSIVFASDRTGTPGIWMLEYDGRAGTPALVKSNMGWVEPIGFNSLGSFYYGIMSHVSDVYVADVDLEAATHMETPTRVVPRMEGRNASPEWSPDGETLAYVSRGGSLCLRSQRTGQERQVRLEPKTTFYDRLRWSPDSRFILFTAASGGGKGMFRLDVATEKVTNLYEVGGGMDLLGIAPDSRSFYYNSSSDSRLHVRDLATGNDQVLFRGASELGLSPDAKKLAFASSVPNEEPTRMLMSVVEVPNGRPRTLVRGKAGESIRTPTWTPDGKAILFTRFKLGQFPRRTEFWMVSAEAGEARRLGPAFHGGVKDLRVHPDGRQIAFDGGQGRGEVWVLENFLPRQSIETSQRLNGLD